MANNEIRLEPVSSNDIRFLYKLLKERDPVANISHRKMPSYSEHEKFVKSKPYAKWYVIKFKNYRSGSIYLTRQNEIGIFVKKNLRGKNLGKSALEILMEKNPKKRYLANVSPKNTKSQKFFLGRGFKLIQYTYEYIPDA
jgi:hypothetical protein